MPSPKTLIFREASIELQPGERYAGLVLEDVGVGQFAHHLVLLPAKPEAMNWAAATEWAATQGGALPTRQEQALLYANLKAEFDPDWYWSSETHKTNDAYAWDQGFNTGGQNGSHKSYEAQARAVRRLTA
jgi:hypothetical protein